MKLGNASADKLFASQVLWPEFGSPATTQTLDMAACNPSSEKAETRGYLELAGQSTQIDRL